MNLDRFAIHQGTMKNVPTDEFLIKGSENDFKNFSLWMPSLENSINIGLSLEKIKRIIREYKLKIIEISPLHNWAFITDKDRDEKISEIHKICRIAQKLNAEYICAPTLGKGNPELISENLAVLADIALSYQLKIAIEFVPQQQIDCLASAWQLIQKSNRDNVGVLLDTVLFFLSESTLADLETIPVEKIFLVHLSNLSSISEELDLLTLVRNYRTFPNLGKFDLTPLLNKLEQKQYSGYYSLEILNKENINLKAETIFSQAKNALFSLCENFK